MTKQANTDSAANFSDVRASSIGATPRAPDATDTSRAFVEITAGGRKLRGRDVTAIAIADRIVDFCNEHGDVVTNLKLQKLLYYAQAWYLAIYDKPLFPEAFQAWPNGPAQPEVYGHFQSYGPRQIDKAPSGVVLSKQIEEHIKDLMQSYGRLSAFDLDLLSREEFPWIEARKGTPPDEPSRNVISIKTMQRFYKSKQNGKKSG